MPLELGGVDPVKPVALVVLRQLDDEAHRAPPAERDEHGAAHLDGRVALAAVLGHGVGIGRVERLRGYVEDDRCEFHDFQYIPSPGRGRRARQGRTKTARLGRARKLRRRRGSGARPLPGEGASRAERNGDDGKIALANGRQEAASSARRRMRGAGRFFGHETAFWHGIAAKIPLSLLALAETPGRIYVYLFRGICARTRFGGHFDGEIAHGDPARRLPTGFRELGAPRRTIGAMQKDGDARPTAPGRTGAPASGLTPNRTPPATRPPCRCAPR